MTIRNGKTEIGPNVMPTHRWMLEGIIDMISNFVQWLPDMDIGFNLNDESRIAVPYGAIEELRLAASKEREQNNSILSTFSHNRNDTWIPFPRSRYREHLSSILAAKKPFRNMAM